MSRTLFKEDAIPVINWLNENDTIPTRDAEILKTELNKNGKVSICCDTSPFECDAKFFIEMSHGTYRIEMLQSAYYWLTLSNRDFFLISPSKIPQILSDFKPSSKSNRLQYVDWQSFKSLMNVKTETLILVFDYLNDTMVVLNPNDSNFVSNINVNQEFLDTIEIYHNAQPFSPPWMKTRVEINENEKENDTTMKMAPMNFDFGPVNSDAIALSPYGIAIRKGMTDNWITYNPATSQTVDVSGFTFDFKGMIYKMPVPVNSLRPGDTVLHQGRPMYVTGIVNTQVDAIDILASEAKVIIPVTNMFGFNFVTKIVSLINLNASTPSPDQPFGNLMPFFMLSSVMGEGDGNNFFENMDIGKLIVFSAMTGNANPFSNMFNFEDLTPPPAPTKED